MNVTRRQLLTHAAKFTLVAAPFGWGLGCRGAHSCVNSDRLTTSQLSFRASLHFTERSPNGPEKECAGCGFFAAKSGDDHSCGNCQILMATVNPRGYCDSWSPGAG